MANQTRLTRFLRLGALFASLPLLIGTGKIDKFRVGIYDLKKYDISIHWKKEDGKPYSNLLDLKKNLEKQGKNVVALTNAGIYGKDYSPLGLHIENGKILRKLNKARGGGNFFLKPNGVFYITKDGAGVAGTRRIRRTSRMKWATQSGPLLFDHRGIHPRFRKQSESTFVRNAIGVRADGKVVIAISRVPVTFWELATYMKTKQKCKSALYLDGSISKMWRTGEAMPIQFTPFVGIIAVTKKKAANKKALSAAR